MFSALLNRILRIHNSKAKFQFPVFCVWNDSPPHRTASSVYCTSHTNGQATCQHTNIILDNCDHYICSGLVYVAMLKLSLNLTRELVK